MLGISALGQLALAEFPGVVVTTRKRVGWPLRHNPEDLERRLKSQRDNTFGRRRFEELIAEAEEKAEELKSKPAKAALTRAIEAAQEAVEEAPHNSISDALEAAVLAGSAAKIIKSAHAVYEMAIAAMAAKRQRDDEEVIEILLLH